MRCCNWLEDAWCLHGNVSHDHQRHVQLTSYLVFIAEKSITIW
jgi:hypothetical protein